MLFHSVGAQRLNTQTIEDNAETKAERSMTLPYLPVLELELGSPRHKEPFSHTGNLPSIKANMLPSITPYHLLIHPSHFASGPSLVFLRPSPSPVVKLEVSSFLSFSLSLALSRSLSPASSFVYFDIALFSSPGIHQKPLKLLVL